jgi:hypothetical protein
MASARWMGKRYPSKVSKNQGYLFEGQNVLTSGDCIMGAYSEAMNSREDLSVQSYTAVSKTKSNQERAVVFRTLYS